MAIYHCSIKIIGRSQGRSAVACSAYRAGEKLQDKETGITHDFSHKKGVVYSEVMLPWKAPKEYQDRETLWNAVQKVETQRNAQLAREIEVALPREMSRDQQIEAVRDYVDWYFVQAGMCADWALHDKGDGNPHAHILLTTRPIRRDGRWDVKQRSVYKLDEYGQKIPVTDPKTGKQKVRLRKGKGAEKLWEREKVSTTTWDNRGKAEEWREGWAFICNQYLAPDQQIDHRSYARQGIDQEPTRHEGYAARKIQAEYNAGKRSEPSELVMANQETRSRNAALNRIHAALKAIAEKIQEAEEEKTRLDQREDFSWGGWSFPIDSEPEVIQPPSTRSTRLVDRMNAAKKRIDTSRAESGLQGQNQGKESHLKQRLQKKKNKGWER